jgi:molybdopterin molybdotransferase
MVGYQEALEIVLAQTRSFGTEEINLDGAFGRVLAEPIRADRDYPPFPRATMDGYALRYSDLERGIRRFRVVETIFAGLRAERRIGSAESYKIMTGAAVPEDADLVIRREDVEEGMGDDVGGGDREVGEEEKEVEVVMRNPEGWRPFLNIARRGEDLRAGDLVVDKPCRCGPAVMGLLATLGKSTVTVARWPQIGLITTGNEVVEPGTPVSPVQIRNNNHWMLVGALRGEYLGLTRYAHAGDDPVELKGILDRFLDLDVLIVTGGVSAGDADHVPRGLEQLGVRRLFHKIAMRPGKPTWCGVSPEGGMVFALPGNPFSCLVNFKLLIAPYVHACWGLERSMPMALALREGRKKRTPLDEFFPVRVEGAPAMLTQIPLNTSGDIRLGIGANALALHPSGCGDLESGTEVRFYSFA